MSSEDSMLAALGRIPSGLFILTACHEERRSGMLVSWVQQTCFKPPMISVALAKNRPLLPLVTTSRRFGVCQLAKSEKVLLRKFAGGVEANEDPFLGFDLLDPSKTSVPILTGALGYLECEVSAHMDLEADHDLFVGKVIGGALLAKQEPMVHIRENGLRY